MRGRKGGKRGKGGVGDGLLLVLLPGDTSLVRLSRCWEMSCSSHIPARSTSIVPTIEPLFFLVNQLFVKGKCTCNSLCYLHD